MRTLLLAGATLSLLTSVAAADFYVVQDTSTRTCMIVEGDRAPEGERRLVEGTKSYTSREQAQAAMNAAAACKTAASTTDKGAAPKGTVRMLTQAPSGAWSITRLYKQAVYNANNERIGEVDDVLMTKDGRAAALVIGIGGFLGLGETHVLVPFEAANITDRDGSSRLVMNTTRDELKGSTYYRYDRSKYLWVQVDRKDDRKDTK